MTDRGSVEVKRRRTGKGLATGGKSLQPSAKPVATGLEAPVLAENAKEDLDSDKQVSLRLTCLSPAAKEEVVTHAVTEEESNTRGSRASAADPTAASNADEGVVKAAGDSQTSLATKGIEAGPAAGTDSAALELAKPGKRGSSKFAGVVFHKTTGKWQATLNGKYLGRFATEELAAEARLAHARGQETEKRPGPLEPTSAKDPAKDPAKEPAKGEDSVAAQEPMATQLQRLDSFQLIGTPERAAAVVSPPSGRKTRPPAAVARTEPQMQRAPAAPAPPEPSPAMAAASLTWAAGDVAGTSSFLSALGRLDALALPKKRLTTQG